MQGAFQNTQVKINGDLPADRLILTVGNMTPTWHTFWIVLFAAAALHGTYVFLLLFFKGPAGHGTRFLGALCLVISAQMANYLFFITGFITSIPHFFGVISPLLFLIGPLYYFFVRYETTPLFAFRPIMLIHFVPSLLEAVLTMKIYLLTAEVKLQYIQALSGGQVPHDAGMMLYSLAYLLHMAGYGVAGYIIIRADENRFVKPELKKAASLFPILLLAQLLLFVGAIVFQPIGQAVEMGMAVIMATFLHALGYLLISPNTAGKKYKTSPLTAERIHEHSQALLSLMEREKPFLQKDLTLSDLAHKLDLSAPYVSQVLRQGLKTGFYELVNAYRIREAQERLRDVMFRHYKIEAIGEDVGFRNKVSFIAAFKKNTRLTPSEFRKKALG